MALRLSSDDNKQRADNLKQDEAAFSSQLQAPRYDEEEDLPCSQLPNPNGTDYVDPSLQGHYDMLQKILTGLEGFGTRDFFSNTGKQAAIERKSSGQMSSEQLQDTHDLFQDQARAGIPHVHVHLSGVPFLDNKSIINALPENALSSDGQSPPEEGIYRPRHLEATEPIVVDKSLPSEYLEIESEDQDRQTTQHKDELSAGSLIDDGRDREGRDIVAAKVLSSSEDPSVGAEATSLGEAAEDDTRAAKLEEGKREEVTSQPTFEGEERTDRDLPTSESSGLGDYSSKSSEDLSRAEIAPQKEEETTQPLLEKEEETPYEHEAASERFDLPSSRDYKITEERTDYTGEPSEDLDRTEIIAQEKEKDAAHEKMEDAQEALEETNTREETEETKEEEREKQPAYSETDKSSLASESDSIVKDRTAEYAGKSSEDLEVAGRGIAPSQNGDRDPEEDVASEKTEETRADDEEKTPIFTPGEEDKALSELITDAVSSTAGTVKETLLSPFSKTGVSSTASTVKETLLSPFSKTGDSSSASDEEEDEEEVAGDESTKHQETMEAL